MKEALRFCQAPRQASENALGQEKKMTSLHSSSIS